MKSKILIFFVFITQIILSQSNNLQIKCNTTSANASYFKNNQKAYEKYLEFNKNSKYLKNYFNKSGEDKTFIIPVVFHVYGNNFNGKSVNDALIEQALADLNKDYQGLNDDYNTVNGKFTNIRGKLNITFKLAQKDQNGDATAGINYYAGKSGYGNGYGMESQITADAWDNYKYMNVYIQNDLYNDGVTNNSGVAWYPDTEMSDNNLSRVVYNGAYLATNTNKEFASVLSHEFGHWLNLIHTFEGGCSGTDYVDDTPKEDGYHNLKCSSGTNCDGDYVNFENYMGYNGANGCYKMFTLGQIDRVIDALEHPARKPLWQVQNLIDTGLQSAAINDVAPTVEITSPANNKSFEESASIIVTASITDLNGSSNINRVEFYLDNILINTVNSAPFKNTYTNLSLGNHVIKATVFDNSELSGSNEIQITITKKMYYPEIKWITSIPSYSQDNTAFATGETSRRIEINAYTETHDIIVKGPNNYEQHFTTKLNEAIIINNIDKGTWTVEIPSENKKITKTFEQ